MNYVICTTKSFPRKRMFMVKTKANRTSVAVFKNQCDAENFTKYLIENRCIFQQWPVVDLEKRECGVNALESSKFKCPLPTYVSQFFHVKELESDKLRTFLSLNSIPITFIENVSYDLLLNLKADVTEETEDQEIKLDYIFHLDKLYKYKSYRYNI